MRGVRTAGSAATLAIALVACGGHGVAALTAPVATPAGATSSTSQAGGAVYGNPDDWPEFGYNPERTGVGPADTGIVASNLSSLRRIAVHVDGTVDSSAIEVHAVSIGGRTRDVVVVTTTYGKTIAIDPSTGKKLWEYTPSDIRAYEGSSQITTSSPIVDPDGLYVYSASPNGFIHKLVLASGQQVWATRVTFDPQHEKIAAPLNISGPNLVLATGGYIGDAPPYDSHVVIIDRTSGRILHVWNAQCSDRHQLIYAASCHGTNTSGDDAIWGRNAPVIEPGSGRILVATGNGPFNGRTNWGDSVLELSADATGVLHNWTPTNQAYLNSNDLDVGSAAPALLGHQLALQGGKAGVLDLLDLDRLDGTSGPAGPRTGGQVQQISSPGGGQVLTAPAVWTATARTYAFVADDSGTDAYVLELGRSPRLARVWQNGTSGTSPIVAGGLLYIYDEQGGRLNVYVPTSGRLLDSLAAASGHWNSPIAVDGRIILPVGNANDHSTSGEIFIYHLPGR